VTVLPATVKPARSDHLERVRRRHERDPAAGHGRVYWPDALGRKLPGAADWVWQHVFPSGKLSRDPCSGVVRRHHAHEAALSRAITEAVRFDCAGAIELAVRPGAAEVRNGAVIADARRFAQPLSGLWQPPVHRAVAPTRRRALPDLRPPALVPP
jgi:hypothetical protein